MITFPNISPEIFSINLWGFDFALRWYALSYIAGFICAITIMKSFLRKTFLWKNNTSPMSVNDSDSFLTFLIVGVIAGGGSVCSFHNPAHYLLNPVDIIRIWDGGMSFHGGFIGVILAVLFFCHRNSIPLWQGSDLVALSSPPGLLFGRVANFINAELWGKPTEVPWGVIFPGQRAQDVVAVLSLVPGTLTVV